MSQDLGPVREHHVSGGHLLYAGAQAQLHPALLKHFGGVRLGFLGKCAQHSVAFIHQENLGFVHRKVVVRFLHP